MLQMLIKKKINKFYLQCCRLLKINPQFGHPYLLMIEPTNICNLHCPLCPTGNNEMKAPKGYMSWERFEKVANELSPYLIESSFIGYGEPLLHPRIFNMVEFLSTKKINTTISTNGLMINEEVAVSIVKSRLGSVTIAVDGASEETYQKYRKGGSFEVVINAIRLIQKAKIDYKTNSPRVKLQFIIMKHNEHEVEKIKDIAKSLNVKLKLKTVSTSKSNKEFLPTNRDFSRYTIDKKHKLTSKKRQSKACEFAWFWAVVNWDGSVVPCCKDPHRIHLLGVVDNKYSYMDIWKSKEYSFFRKNLIQNRSKLKLCNKCVLSLTIPE